ncbi:MAG: hypothetical protein LBR90_04640 [Elusimicrobiota bacterium]|jgi:cell division septal protein FtsQ|nr:hypothetical protein [Elusimicrobiota bacterium]
MYKPKKPVKKKFAPVRSRRKNARNIKKILLVILTLALCGLVIFGLIKLSALLLGLGGPNKFSWKIKNIRIQSGSGDTDYEALKYIGFEEGAALTRADAETLENLLQTHLKQAAKVSVRRGLISKDLIVKIKKHTPRAAVIYGGKTRYLAGTGVLFEDADPLPAPSLLAVEAAGPLTGDALPKEAVKLIEEAAAFKEAKISKLKLDLDKKTFSLELQTPAFAEMGPWQNAPQKLKTLAQILQDAQSKNIKPPYSVNFNFYHYGKIYLKPHQ